MNKSKVSQTIKLDKLFLKAKMGNWVMEWGSVGMQGMGWKCGCGESGRECGESGWEFEKCGESVWWWKEFKVEI